MRYRVEIMDQDGLTAGLDIREGRARDFQSLRELRLGHPQRLSPRSDPVADNFVNRIVIHGLFLIQITLNVNLANNVLFANI